MASDAVSTSNSTLKITRPPYHCYSTDGYALLVNLAKMEQLNRISIGFSSQLDIHPEAKNHLKTDKM